MTALFVIIFILAVISSFFKKKPQKVYTQKKKSSSLSDALISSTYNKPLAKQQNAGQSKRIYTSQENRTPVKQTYSYQDDSIIEVENTGIKIDYSTSYSQEYWGLGTKYKKKLNLNDEDTKTLNSLIDTANKFNSIEHCATTIINLFINSKRHIDQTLKQNSSSLENEINSIAEIEITKHYRFRKNSQNYKSQLESFKNTINQCIYKQCENYLREIYFVGRKTEMKWYIYAEEAQKEYSNRIAAHIDSFLRTQKIVSPDDKSEIELNAYGKSRWKNKLEVLKEKINNTTTTYYYEKVMQLAIQNKHNPAIENIFFEASKTMSKFDKELSLKLYIYYIHYDLISDVFDNKQFAKTIQKSLFKNDGELKSFEALINEFISDRKLEKALANASTIFAPKRKKIQLDKEAINQVKQQHSGTVELLNEYLKDENDDINLQNNASSSDEVKLSIQYPENQNATFKKEILLNEIQANTLIFFSKNGFSISNTELEAYAKSKNSFKNSLIDSINDACFEQLDDILIEEDDNNYVINENYYSKILAQ